MNLLLAGKIVLNIVTLYVCFVTASKLLRFTLASIQTDDAATKQSFNIFVSAALLTALAYYPA